MTPDFQAIVCISSLSIFFLMYLVGELTILPLFLAIFTCSLPFVTRPRANSNGQPASAPCPWPRAALAPRHASTWPWPSQAMAVASTRAVPSASLFHDAGNITTDPFLAPLGVVIHAAAAAAAGWQYTAAARGKPSVVVV